MICFDKVVLRIDGLCITFSELKKAKSCLFRLGVLDLDNDDHHISDGDKYNTVYESASDGKTLSQQSGSIEHDKDSGLLDLAKNNGWEAALKTYYSGMPDAIVRNFSKNRTNWLSLVPAHNNSSRGIALEIGPGTGGVSRQLSLYYDLLTLDRSFSNCAFLQECASQSSLPIQTIKKNALPLPFADAQFDLVVMVGSLEWLAFYQDTTNPSLTIQMYLHEAFRILKPSGTLYISSENASYIAYYLGLKEAHTMLSFISMLDFSSANQLSEHFTGKPFKNPTYTPSQMEIILKLVGFSSVESYWLHPDYSTPAYIISLDAPPSILNYFITQRLNPWDFAGERSFVYRFYCLLNKKLLKHFVEHYCVVASK